MNCPVCKVESLTLSLELEDGPPALACSGCPGRWISGNPYYEWLHSRVGTAPHPPVDEDTVPVADTKKAKICPECGHILIRYRVASGLSFYMERCGVCAGIWLDPGEWESLVRRGLHDDLHLVPSSEWQHEILREESRRARERSLRERVGEADFQKASEFRGWLRNHPHHPALLAFLGDEPPL